MDFSLFYFWVMIMFYPLKLIKDLIESDKVAFASSFNRILINTLVTVIYQLYLNKWLCK